MAFFQDLIQGIENFAVGVWQTISPGLNSLWQKFAAGVTLTDADVQAVSSTVNDALMVSGIPEGEIPEVAGDIGKVLETVKNLNPEELDQVIKAFANSDEVIGKISKVSTAMAKKVLATTTEEAAKSGGVLKKIGGFLVSGAHLAVLSALVGITAIRTATVDRAFLGARWNNTIDQLPLPQYLKDALNIKPATFVTTGGLSATDLQTLFNFYKANGVTSMKDPKTGKSEPYTDVNFAAAMTTLYANNLTKGLPTSAKVLTAAIQPFLTAAPVVAAAGPATVAPPATPTKVYSGIIAQGVLQPAQTFTPQPKTIINNLDELTQVLHDNLASYISSLNGRLRYEVTIVPRVTLPDGSIAVAGVQRVIKGYTKAGKAEYKNVLNKYAKVAIYIMENAGRRVKLDEIVLGATDAIGFQPTLQALAALNTAVQQNIVAKTLGDITAVHAPAETTIVSPPTQTPAEVAAVQAAIDLAAAKGRPATTKVSTTYAEALDNLVPFRFQTAPMPNGFPVTLLYVGETPNILYNATEITLQQAKELLNSVPKNHLVDLNGLVYGTSQPPVYQVPGKVDFYPGSWVRLASLGSFNGNIDAILSGNLPQSQFVWAYKAKSGEIQTFVPLANIPK